MSLRVRLGLAAGVAVAVAVIAVAVSAYAGTRSELQGQVDQSLHSLIHSILAPGGGPGTGIGNGGINGLGATSRFSATNGLGTANGFGDINGFGGINRNGSLNGNASASANGPAAGSGFGFQQPPGAAEPLGVRDEGLGLDGRRVPAFGGAPGTLTLVYANGGTWVPAGQKYRIPPDGRMKAIAKRGRGEYLTNMTVDGSHIRVLATGIGRYGALLVALPLKDVDQALSSQLLLLLGTATGGIAFAALLGILVARTALAPIARFTRQTETIAANPERLDQERLDVHGGDELARLAQTFNRTLDALQRSVESQRNLVADASHELRTPIATIRANLQLMRDEALLSAEDREALRTDVIDELDELTALVGDVVELARGGKPTGEPGDVRLDLIVAAAAERARRRAPGLDVQSSLEPTLVRGEGSRIARAVANLFDNAAKWSPAGGVIDVDLHDGTLAVRDHGPGFHEHDLPFVFDRFHRARDARSKPGSGLGLAIVRQAAEAHGGFVEASNAPDGGALMRIGFGEALELSGAETAAPLSA
jgi:two-component system sensor histidine kinase MprB